MNEFNLWNERRKKFNERLTKIINKNLKNYDQAI